MADDRDNIRDAFDGAGTDEPSAIALAPGAIIGGVYEIIELIGRGGMGEVYLARHITLNKRCALKVIPPEQVNEVTWARFQLEAKAVAKLDHLNLVRVTDLGVHDECLPFYAMDYVEGKILCDLIAELGRLPLETVLEIFIQICDGLYCAHRNGLLHRDLKPANIMVSPTGDGKLIAKVLDFGLVKLTRHTRDKQSLTAVGEVFGSPNYMSPEQCNNNELDERSDIYSLGCTMFECLTGRPPFFSNITAAIFFSHLESAPPTLASVVGPDEFPPEMEAVIAKVLRKDPELRYQTLLELQEDLENISRGRTIKPVFQPTPFVVEKGVRTSQKGAAKDATKKTSPVAAGLFVAAVIALGGGGYWYMTQHNTEEVPTKISTVAPTSAPVVAPLPVPTGSTWQPATGALQPVAPYLQHQIITASLLLTKPFSTNTQDLGKWTREFVFPTDVTVGYLSTPTQTVPSPASGLMKFPMEQLLVFVPGEIVKKYPECLKRFRPGEISCIKYPPYTDAKIIKGTSYMKKAAALDFSMCRRLTADMIAPLKSFRKTYMLIGSDSNIEGLELAKSGTLDKCKEVYLQSSANLVPLLTELKKHTALTKLGVWDTLTKQDIDAITKQTPLTDLSLAKTNLKDADLAVLSTLPNLERLDVHESQVTIGAIENLRKFKNLKKLTIKSSTFNDTDLEKLKAEFPKLEIL